MDKRGVLFGFPMECGFDMGKVRKAFDFRCGIRLGHSFCANVAKGLLCVINSCKEVFKRG